MCWPGTFWWAYQNGPCDVSQDTGHLWLRRYTEILMDHIDDHRLAEVSNDINLNSIRVLPLAARLMYSRHRSAARRRMVLASSGSLSVSTGLLTHTLRASRSRLCCSGRSIPIKKGPHGICGLRTSAVVKSSMYFIFAISAFETKTYFPTKATGRHPRRNENRIFHK